MKKVLIILSSAPGHIIPTFRIAKILQDGGYKVVYMIEAAFKNMIIEQGFEAVVGTIFLFANQESMGIFDQPNKKITERLLDRISNSTLNATIKNVLKFEEIVEKIAPDSVLLDVFLSYNYILLKNKRPTTFIQTMVSTYKDAATYPLSSSLMSSNKGLIKLSWMKYKFIRQGRTFFYFGDSMWGLTQRALKRLNRTFDNSLLTWDKCFHIGIKNVPEWGVIPI